MKNYNIDEKTVQSFGQEWSDFDQSELPEGESLKIFNSYFSIFPWSSLPENASGFDMGCGSGRWARWVAPRVGELHCIDPSKAIEIAKKNLAKLPNVKFYNASVDDKCLTNSSQDFGYSLGVLHHVPNTEQAIKSCVDLLKPGAPLLLYLYYSFDNRSSVFRLIWRASNLLRKFISKLPEKIKHYFCDLLAVFVYYPLSKFSYFVEKIGFNPSNIPLSAYRDKSFYTMRTDSRDRFGTPLEHRFSKNEIEKMMLTSGLKNIIFSSSEPYWCAVGTKK